VYERTLSRRVVVAPVVGALATLVLVLGSGGVGRANSADIFGVGSKSAGMGDAATALASGPTAAYYNPAGLANGDRAQLHFSALAYKGWLQVRSTTQGIQNPYEFALGLTVAVPFKGRLHHRVWLGLLLTAHPDILARVISHLPTDAFYPYFDNRTQRLVLIPALAFRLVDSKRRGRLTLGLGANVFAGLTGVIIGEEGASRSLEARVSEGLSGIFRVVAGLRYSWRWLNVGFTYRQQFSMPFKTDSFNFVAGGDLNLNVDAEGLFSPHTFVLGMAVTPRKNLSVALDVSYALWSLWRGPFVDVTSVLPLVGNLVGDTPQVDFKDVVALRVGAEYRVSLPRKLVMPLRVGLGFETSPVPDQPGRTNLLDGHKLMFSIGGGIDLGRMLKRRVWVDLHLRLHLLVPRTIRKKISVSAQECPATAPPLGPDQALSDEVPCDRTDDTTLGLQISNPGYPYLKVKGLVLSGGFSLGVEL
jgi:hypothetical protein